MPLSIVDDQEQVIAPTANERPSTSKLVKHQKYSLAKLMTEENENSPQTLSSAAGKKTEMAQRLAEGKAEREARIYSLRKHREEIDNMLQELRKNVSRGRKWIRG